MIQELLRVMIIGLLAVIFTVVLKKHCGEISILLGLSAGILIGIFFLEALKPVIAFVEDLRELSGLDAELLEPVLKCLGIGFLSQIAVNVCNDSGQTAIGKMIEISGSVLCMYISIPLFRSVLSLLGSMGGEP